ncbi:hypothetical protein O1D97_14750 [Marinomonas sp. 15G1-11]|mgnify:CR=1 FL=1|uniref:Uncharacterized protein n=1 Tax=Marinomonas phaeophyticola TaxID=3004091 RepID=A0ABT4JX20_9GAMM|nr:hypothetical protein [Marinomonas sp. 15G1-11]MCZ2722833.1 hypothetical protein [Marinomonas sp. 15G1-11]
MIEFILFAFVCVSITWIVKELSVSLHQEKTELKPIKIKEEEKTKSIKRKTNKL